MPSPARPPVPAPVLSPLPARVPAASPDPTDASSVAFGATPGANTGGTGTGSASSKSNAKSASKHGSSHKSLPEIVARSTSNEERYHLEAEIARGGMGAVVRATDRDIRREVAIKYLLDQKDAKKKVRFVEEAQITGQLEHPNIVPIHELGVDPQNRLFFSMKMVRGRSLQQILDGLRKRDPAVETAYPLAKLLTIFIGVCHALAYSHSRNVIHRDLKPANIMIGDFGEVYVMDWGLAKVIGDADAATPDPSDESASKDSGNPGKPESESASADEGLTTFEAMLNPGQTAIQPSAPLTHAGAAPKVATARDESDDLTQDGAVLGTPVYMPPEQASGDAEKIDRRSDIYSLGAILYELAVLKPPIDRTGGAMAILMRVAQGEILSAETANPERVRAGKVPRELLAIAQKAMAKSKKARYQSVEDFRRDIELYQEGKAVSAKQDTFWETVWKLIKRNKGASVTAAIAFVVFNLGALWALSLVLAAKSRAETALAALEKEQKEKRVRAQKSANLFLADARQSANNKNLDYALAQLGVVLEADPENADARLLRAQVLIVQKNYDAAREDLEAYMKLRAADKLGGDLLRLARTARADDADVAHQFADVFYRQKMFGLADQVELDNDMLIISYRKRIDDAWPGAGKKLVLTGKKLKLDLDKSADDLTPVQGMTLDSFSAAYSSVRDLAPLAGMPLTRLVLTRTPIRDLSPIKGMQLAELNLSYCDQIIDFEVLKGMPIKDLQLNGTKIADLSPLKGMPLESLGLVACDQIKDFAPLQGSPVAKLWLGSMSQPRDLTPLKGLKLSLLDMTSATGLKDITFASAMPLDELVLASCTKLESLTPLEGMKLTKLTLPGGPVCENLAPLDGMPLQTLTCTNARTLSDLSPLRSAKLKQLTLTNCDKIADLSPLKGQPIASLMLSGCDGIKDLSPLEGMPLNYVDLSKASRLEDLSPLALAKSDLKTLLLVDCASVKDLSHLRGLNLGTLDIRGTQITDLTPLEDIRVSDIFAFRPAVITNGMDELRKSNVKTIAVENAKGVRVNIPAASFWKRYEAGEFQ